LVAVNGNRWRPTTTIADVKTLISTAFSTVGDQRRPRMGGFESRWGYFKPPLFAGFSYRKR
jgi:hypothetical protein